MRHCLIFVYWLYDCTERGIAIPGLDIGVSMSVGFSKILKFYVKIFMRLARCSQASYSVRVKNLVTVGSLYKCTVRAVALHSASAFASALAKYSSLSLKFLLARCCQASYPVRGQVLFSITNSLWHLIEAISVMSGPATRKGLQRMLTHKLNNRTNEQK